MQFFILYYTNLHETNSPLRSTKSFLPSLLQWALIPLPLQFFMEKACLQRVAPPVPARSDLDPCCCSAVSLITGLGFPRRSEDCVAPRLASPFTSHGSISGQLTIPWDRGRGKRLQIPPRNSTVVTQKTEKLEILTLNARNTKSQGNRQRHRGSPREKTELNSVQQTFISTYCVPGPEGTLCTKAQMILRFLA